MKELSLYGLTLVPHSAALPDFSVLPNQAINILATYHLPFLQPERFVQQQERAIAAQPKMISNHGVFSIYQHGSGLYMIKKRFAETRAYPDTVVAGLVSDYDQYVADLRTVGIEHLAENYHYQDKKDATGTVYIEVEQLFLPYGTALEFVRENKDVASITKRVITDFILPVLQSDRHLPHDTDSPVYLDATFKNFAILPDEDQIKLYYVDFYVPRVRNEDGTVKRYPGVELDVVNDYEIEYKYFTKPGILHNFIKRNAEYFFNDGSITPDRQEAYEHFLATADLQLAPYIKRYFPGLSARDIVGLPTQDIMDLFVTP